MVSTFRLADEGPGRRTDGSAAHASSHRVRIAMA
jgi:hypothetical protein